MARLDGYDNFSGHLIPQAPSMANGDEAAVINAVGTEDTTPLCGALDPPDNRVQTSAVIGFKTVVMIMMVTTTSVLPVVPNLPVHVYSLIVYIQCSVWALFYILDAHLRRQHSLLSCYGFIDFYQKTKNLRRASLNVMSSGSIMMLLVSVILADYCRDRFHCPPHVESQIYLQVIVAIEALVLIPVHIYYLKLNFDFHRKKVSPDIEPQDFITSILQTQSTTEIGFRDNGAVEDIVERQSDMIRYLKQYNTFLKQKVLRLNQEVETTRTQQLINV